MATQLIIPRALDANGDAASGAKAYVYETGTVTPVTVYTDTALSVAHASPMVANGAGYFAQAFYGGSTALKVVMTDSGDATLVTYDPVPLVSLSASAASDVTHSPTTENPSTDVQTAINNLSDGSATFSGFTSVSGGVIDTADIVASAMSGSDATLVTGTAGASGNLAHWNADGDLVDASIASSDVATTSYVDGRVSVFRSSTPVSFSAGGLQQWAHGLGAEPDLVSFILECKTAEYNYTVGDRIYLGNLSNGSSANDVVHSVVLDSTNISVRWDSNSSQLAVTADESTGATAVLTPANWDIYVKAVRFA